MRITKFLQHVKPAPADCRCSHDRAAHAHFRSGSDCALCGPSECARFHAVRLHSKRPDSMMTVPPAHEFIEEAPIRTAV